MDTETRASILVEARTWIGTPFHHKGTIKGVGVDCGGFIHGVYSKFAPIKGMPGAYAEDWSVHKDNNEIYLSFISEYVRETDNPMPADICVWRFGRAYSHGTILLGRGEYIHAWGRTRIGSVTVSKQRFFSDKNGKLRDCKFFTLDYKWLS